MTETNMSLTPASITDRMNTGFQKSASQPESSSGGTSKLFG